MKEWYLDNCKATRQGLVVCVHDNEVGVLSAMDEEVAEKEVSDENIKEFLRKNSSFVDVE